MRSSSIGTTTTQPMTYSLDNLSIFYTYPYTIENCDNLADGYRFGFNGKEKESDMYGESNAYDFGARIYDGRIGKWLSVDPLQEIYPFASPYNFTLNSPIANTDPDGQRVRYYVLTFDHNGTAHFKLESTKNSLFFNKLEYVNVRVPQLGNIAYTFDPFGPNLNYAGSGTNLSNSGNNINYWEEFKADPLKAILSGNFQTDEQLAKQGAMEIAFALLVQKVISSGNKASLKYRMSQDGSYNPNSYRANLQIKTGKLGTGYDAHHTMPKAKDMASYFKNAGIDVNDPENLIWRNSADHSTTDAGRANSAKHLSLWRQFRKDNPNADKSAILKQRDVIEKEVWGDTKGDKPKN
jgi:RHS repeat-associated protein